jgi:hypothetical protein
VEPFPVQWVACTAARRIKRHVVCCAGGRTDMQLLGCKSESSFASRHTAVTKPRERSIRVILSKLWSRAAFSGAPAAGVGIVVCALLATPAAAGPITAGAFYEFGFTDAGVAATGCDPADPAGPFCFASSGTPTLEADAPPWTFIAPAGGSTLTVVDVFEAGDQFEVLDFGAVIGMTSLPGIGDCGDDPVVCLADSAMSSGTFALAAGAHSLTIVPLLSPTGGGVGYFAVDAVAVPEPATWALLAIGVGGMARRRLRTRG